MTSTDKSTKQQPEKDTSNNSDEDDRTVFVGNLSEKVTDELLYELFLQVRVWSCDIGFKFML